MHGKVKTTEGSGVPPQLCSCTLLPFMDLKLAQSSGLASPVETEKRRTQMQACSIVVVVARSLRLRGCITVSSQPAGGQLDGYWRPAPC